MRKPFSNLEAIERWRELSPRDRLRAVEELQWFHWNVRTKLKMVPRDPGIQALEGTK